MARMDMSAAEAFPTIRFKGTLRPSQRDVVAIARKKLARNQKRLYIVAPPGSGKTILGLYLWAECIRRPALVLSPNSAIQAQWAARVEMFHVAGGRGGEAVYAHRGAGEQLVEQMLQQGRVPRGELHQKEIFR